MRKNVAILVALTMLITVASGFITPSSANAATTFKLGDKIQFGSYLGEKLTWTVIEMDNAGNPLILADSLIGSKAYDAPDLEKKTTYTWQGSESGTLSINTRFEWGVSTIRDWLNSSVPDASKISYTKGVSPYDRSNGNYMGYYAGEGGFLDSKNFSATETDLIKAVDNKSFLIQYEQNLKEGGSHYLEIPQDVSWDFRNVIKYFDNAYYRVVKDKVFLPNLYEYNKAYEVMGDDLGSTDLLPAAKQLLKDNCGFTGNIIGFQLRDTCMLTDELVPINIIMTTKYEPSLNIGGYTGAPEQTGQYLEFKYFGVRPACWIDASKIKSLGGLGITTYPYVLNGTPAQTIKGAANISINGSDVKFIAASGAPFIDKASRTQVPLRVTMESYGAAVSWDSASKTAIVEKNGIKVQVPVGKNYIVVNGQNQAIDTSAQIVSGKTYLPIKAVIVALGGEVSWDQATKTVIINKKNN